jgi:NAD+ kinase
MNIQSVGIVTKPRLEQAALVASKLADWFRERGIQAVVEDRLANEIDSTQSAGTGDGLLENADLVVVIGGDGTLLATARLLRGRPVPVLAINLGGLGFLTEVTLSELYPQLEKVLSGGFVTDRRVLLESSLVREGEPVAFHQALNDVVINKGTLARIIDLETRVNGQYVSTFRSDGLIIATPTGSTAYNLSAGGPIVHPQMSAMLMTPICSHTLTTRPLVLPGDMAVAVTLMSRSDEGVYITIDGQIGIEMHCGDRLDVRKATSELLLVAPAGKNYFDVLRGKLNWG